MRNLTHQIKLCFLACFVLLATLPQATIAQTQLRDKIDVVGYYFVEPAQVVQDSQSAAITLTIPVPRGETFEYAKGLQVVFITEKPNGNSGKYHNPNQFVRRSKVANTTRCRIRNWRTGCRYYHNRYV